MALLTVSQHEKMAIIKFSYLSGQRSQLWGCYLVHVHTVQLSVCPSFPAF